MGIYSMMFAAATARLSLPSLTTGRGAAASFAAGVSLAPSGRYVARFIESIVFAMLLAFIALPAARAVTIGDTAVLSAPDNGNGNLLLVQSATLAQTATIQTLSFYVTSASGHLILGIYDSTGPNGGPGTLKASTASFTPATGWNVANVTQPVSLRAGTYWLAYLPSSDNLSFMKTNGSGNCAYFSYTFGAMPSKFSTSPTSCTPTTWSFYATLAVATGTAVNGTCGSSNGASLASAPTTNLCSAGTASAVTGSGPWSWTCAGSNGGATSSCSASLQAASDPPASGSVPFVALHTYYMSPTGSDSNSGLTAAAPWATPNHAVNCGDVIIAAPGTYGYKANYTNGYPFFGNFHTVSNCPSTTGGIDGAGGVYFAVVLCGGSDIGSTNGCVIDGVGNTAGYYSVEFDGGVSNWAFEGFYFNTGCTGSATGTNCSRSFGARVIDASGTTGYNSHHLALINSIVVGSEQSFGGNDGGNF